MPKREYRFWVYMLSNRSHTLYLGVTNSLATRVAQHRQAIPGTYTAKYNITRLVYFEFFQYIQNAINREKELKHWTRAQKIALITSANPTWEELLPEDLEPAQQLQTQIPSGDDNQSGTSPRET